MTPERHFAQFRIDHPECENQLEPEANKYGMPLTPSAQFIYFLWAIERGVNWPLDKAKATEECDKLIAQYNEADLKAGRSVAWE